MVSNNLTQDENAVGDLTIGGPDGVVYQSYQDGRTPEALPSPGYYDDATHTVIYTDNSIITSEGTYSPVTADETDSGNFSPMSVSMSASFKGYGPTNPPTGIFRKLETVAGQNSLSAYLNLPNTTDTAATSVGAYDPQYNPGGYRSGDQGYIYTGGHVQGIPGSELDAGLQLGKTGNPGWKPYIWQKGGSPIPHPLVKGRPSKEAPWILSDVEPLMVFQAPGYGTIKDKVVRLSFHGHIVSYDQRRSLGDITYVYAIRGWTRKNSSSDILKRVNSLAQTFNKSWSPKPNGVGGGFYMSGAYILGSSWGDLTDPNSSTDGVTLSPGGQWTPDLTSNEGSYPGTPYVTWLEQNQFFWEQNINLKTQP